MHISQKAWVQSNWPGGRRLKEEPPGSAKAMLGLLQFSRGRVPAGGLSELSPSQHAPTTATPCLTEEVAQRGLQVWR
jgi:hypothetical protein